MKFSFIFILNSILFGVGLAADAFSVSVANALNEHKMRAARMCAIAGTFALFQIAMPMIGWFCVRRAALAFAVFEKFIPWIALIILLFLGIRMIIETVRNMHSPEEDIEKERITGFWTLMLQGVATSIDALSVGFTIEEYTWEFALTESLIIGAVTFALCMGALTFGRAIGKHFSKGIEIAGGVILILIGIEIFITGITG